MGRSRGSRRRCRRELGIHGPPLDGRGNRRRSNSSLALEPPDRRIGGFALAHPAERKSRRAIPEPLVRLPGVCRSNPRDVPWRICLVALIA